MEYSVNEHITNNNYHTMCPECGKEIKFAIQEEDIDSTPRLCFYCNRRYIPKY